MSRKVKNASIQTYTSNVLTLDCSKEDLKVPDKVEVNVIAFVKIIAIK